MKRNYGGLIWNSACALSLCGVFVCVQTIKTNSHCRTHTKLISTAAIPVGLLTIAGGSVAYVASIRQSGRCASVPDCDKSTCIKGNTNPELFAPGDTAWRQRL